MNFIIKYTAYSLQMKWNVDPEIFILFDTLPITYYGALFVTGLLLSYEVIKRVYKSEHIPLENLEQLSTYLILGIVIGARLGHCLFYDFAYFSQHPLEIFLPFRITDGNWQFIGFRGLASHGGALGILIAVLLFIKKTNVNFLWLMDRLSIGIPIACSFIRLGNFMNSEIYGNPTNGNFGVIFLKDDLIPRHPTQLYEAFAYLTVFGVLWYLYKNKSVLSHRGTAFGIFLSFMFTARLIIEFFKENQVGFEDQLLLNMGQLLSVPFILLGIFLIYNSKPKELFNTY